VPKLIKFPGHNIIYSANQPEYQPLPALKLDNKEGEAIFCWQLTWKERLRLLFTGKLWQSIYTFNHPLQPVMISPTAPHLAVIAQTIARQTAKDIKRAMRS
jgi:hypothetical protein